MLKNKLNNYFVSEIIKSYFFVLFSLSLLIWVAQSTKFLSLVTDTGLSVEIYIKYILMIFPKVVSQLMIISIMISLFLSLLKMLDNKEIEIFWLSGISKIEITKLILKISLIPTILALLVYLYIAPYSGLKARELLSKSEFSMINSLVKKQNFNSPLKNLTIFVNKNDNKGNIEQVYIFENLKTVIAKKGRVLNIKNKNYLELEDGEIHEKNSDKKITVVKFNKTLFDFTKYQTDIVTNPKNQERSTFWLINKIYLNKSNKIDKEIVQEIHKRIFKPLFIPLISVFCCFLLYTNSQKINLLKLKIFIFSVSTFLIIFFEILITLSVKNLFFNITLYLLPFLGTVILYFLLKNFLKNEPIN